MAIKFNVTPHRQFDSVELISDGSNIHPEELRALLAVAPAAQIRTNGDRERGIVLIADVPPWALAALVCCYNTMAWVAVYDPRYGGAVVVERFLGYSPDVGDIIVA